MDNEISITVEGADLIARALRIAPQVANPIVKQGVTQSLHVLEGMLAPYPPQPSRMRSNSFNTYVRGKGQMTRASFDEGGSFTGATDGPRGGKPLFNSEDLGQKWGIEVKQERGGFFGLLGNPVSYADVVQGSKQPAYHKETGWVTIFEAAKKAAKPIQMIFNNVAVKIAKAMEAMM